jgi:hypothetical protein
MRPPTHDDPNAIPRNGTEVPLLELDDPSRRPRAAASDERRRRRVPGDAAAPLRAQSSGT